ncbi:MAG: Rep [Circular genetic element sp.]|nr:MAG: Rep [Circular genetic element sp.]
MDIEAFNFDKARQELELARGIPTPWNYSIMLTSSKRKHVWIWSSGPNKGKTTGFLKPLDTNYRCSWYNYNESFQCIFVDS